MEWTSTRLCYFSRKCDANKPKGLGFREMPFRRAAQSPGNSQADASPKQTRLFHVPAFRRRSMMNNIWWPRISALSKTRLAGDPRKICRLSNAPLEHAEAGNERVRHYVPEPQGDLLCTFRPPFKCKFLDYPRR